MNRIRVSLRSERHDVVFALTPEEIVMESGGRRGSLATLVADHSFSTGRGLRTYSWDGILPGRERQSLPFVYEGAWEPPQRVRDRLDEWSQDGTDVRLLISEYGIADRVTVDRFTANHSGGYGDIPFSIELREYRELRVGSRGRRDRGRGRKSHRTSGAMTLFQIAAYELGEGARWREIAAIPENARVLGPDPEVVPAGVGLILPGAP